MMHSSDGANVQLSHNGANSLEPIVLMEDNHNVVTSDEMWHDDLFFDHFELRKCRCDCWFCPSCCRSKAIELRQRLVPELMRFSAIRMLSVTVDPALFPSPLETFLYLRENRCLGKTMQDLRRLGHLYTGRYFAVMEFQETTHQPHFHVLVDAKYVPHDALLRSWSKHRPDGAESLPDGRPAFGTVFVSMEAAYQHPERAAHKVVSYLTKMPCGGIPQWVMRLGGPVRVGRFSTSKRFWATVALNKQEPKRHHQARPRRTRSVSRNYETRIAECGTKANLFGTINSVDEQTNEPCSDRMWLGQVELIANATDSSAVAPAQWSFGAKGCGTLQDACIYIRQSAGGNAVRLVRQAHWFDGSGLECVTQPSPEIALSDRVSLNTR